MNKFNALRFSKDQVQKVFLLLISLCALPSASAQDFSSGGINYTAIKNHWQHITSCAVSTVQDSALSGAVVIPATVSNDNKHSYPVTVISEGAFEDNDKITSLSIGSNVVSIAKRAFSGCTGLTSVDLSASAVSSIGISAFMGCDGITACAYPATLRYIGYGAFCGCRKLAEAKLPKKCAFLGSSAFRDCEQLQTVSLPDSLPEIQPMTFWGCKKLAQITIPDGISVIGQGAFDGCASLVSITFPATVRVLADYVLNGCGSLKSFTISNLVDSIGDKAFGDCQSLTSITIPASVKSMGFAVFSGCSSLSDVTYTANAVDEIRQNMFYGCTALQSFVIPTTPVAVSVIGSRAFAYSGILSADLSTVKDSLGACAFEGCKDLRSLASDIHVKTLGEGAFSSCSSLERVILGDSVTAVEASAFKGSHALTRITLLNPVAPSAPDFQVFDQWNYENTRLEIPAGSESVYAAAPEWKNFKLVATAINDSKKEEVKEVARYAADGRLLISPQRGFTLIKMSNGTVEKVIVK